MPLEFGTLAENSSGKACAINQEFRAGTWSISVSGNWRLTFDIRQNEICDLDLEDYH